MKLKRKDKLRRAFIIYLIIFTIFNVSISYFIKKFPLNIDINLHSMKNTKYKIECNFEIIPLKKGLVWEYYRIRKWQEAGSPKVLKKEYKVKREVIGVFEKNYPNYTKLAIFKETSKIFFEEKYFFILKTSNKYYKIAISNSNKGVFTKIIEEFKTDQDIISNYFGKPFLELPLVEGKKFSEIIDPRCLGVPRTDTLHCWYVEKIEEIPVKIDKFFYCEKVKKYKLAFRQLTGHTVTYYVEGIGETYYESVHHGSVDKECSRLVKFY